MSTLGYPNAPPIYGKSSVQKKRIMRYILNCDFIRCLVVRGPAGKLDYAACGPWSAALSSSDLRWLDKCVCARRAESVTAMINHITSGVRAERTLSVLISGKCADFFFFFSFNIHWLMFIFQGNTPPAPANSYTVARSHLETVTTMGLICRPPDTQLTPRPRFILPVQGSGAQLWPLRSPKRLKPSEKLRA